MHKDTSPRRENVKRMTYFRTASPGIQKYSPTQNGNKYKRHQNHANWRLSNAIQTGKYWALEWILIIQKKTRKWFKYQLLSQNHKLSLKRSIWHLFPLSYHTAAITWLGGYQEWAAVDKWVFFSPVFLQIALCSSNMISHWFRIENVCGHICLLLETARNGNTDYSRIHGYLSLRMASRNKWKWLLLTASF